MKRITLEATDENVLKSIEHDEFNRNKDIKEFIDALELIEGNMFISLDADWGEGKTFYVRQIQKTLEYLVKKKYGNVDDGGIEELEPYFSKTDLKNIGLKNSYLPIYYNAWLYDNNNDPLLSLIFVIIKSCQKYIDTKLESENISSKISSLISSIRPLPLDIRKIKETIDGKDILEEIQTAEEIREKVKGILKEVFEESAQKLVIFVDELDRCKPSYAVETLERLKHYYDDEHIIFVVSINKKELIHTISKLYGDEFNSTRYLNKFFDLNVHMPPINIKKSALFSNEQRESDYLTEMVEALEEYFNLSIRDTLIFNCQMGKLHNKKLSENYFEAMCLSIFVPILSVLSIVDKKQEVQFLNGESEIIEKLYKENENFKGILDSIGYTYQEMGFTIKVGNEIQDTADEKGYNIVEEVYKRTFKRNVCHNSSVRLPSKVKNNFKSICIRLCNNFTE